MEQPVINHFCPVVTKNVHLCRQLAAVRDDDDDRGLEVEGVAALPVHVDARLHPVNVQGVEDLNN